jgi:CRISPR system Cascade subunit CasE
VFLSQLVLDLRNRDVRRDLADIQQLHRTVMSAFPSASGDNARAQHAVLFRIDNDRSATPTLLIQSQIEPDWGRLPAGYLHAAPANPATKPFTALEQIDTGQILRFRLVANPTRKIDTKTQEDGQRRHGRRVELRNEPDQIAWLQRRATAAGFELVNPEETLIVRPLGRMAGRRDTERVTAAAVQFDGLLRVLDHDLFRNAVTAGIGPGKAYGMGLLSLAPPA